MSSEALILSIDQGTTNTKAILVDASGSILYRASRPVLPTFPRPGWVEHDPLLIWTSVRGAVRDCLDAAGDPGLVGVALTNQRESVMVWDRSTGEPVGPLIVWQCRRSSSFCRELRRQGAEDFIRCRTGLPIDPLFSASKLRWLVDHIPDGRRRAEDGALCAGTVDSWLLWNLTDGSVHATDPGNASRTQLFNLETMSWDEELLSLFDIPAPLLPRVAASNSVFGEMAGRDDVPSGVPIAAVLGDSHAALLGQGGFHSGVVKATYGTGTSLMSPVSDLIIPRNGLGVTVAWQLDGCTRYALEGNISATGAAIDWCTELLGLRDAAETAALANSVRSNEGVYVVPAFVGLGAPHWNDDARGLITGITRGTTSAHVARAVVESVAYQVRDVFDAMEESSRTELVELLTDGGASRNNALMQFQADVLGRVVKRNTAEDLSALGAAYAAGLALGVWANTDELAGLARGFDRFEPSCTAAERDAMYSGWKQAVARTIFNPELST
jgi:glycerol kinase